MNARDKILLLKIQKECEYLSEKAEMQGDPTFTRFRASIRA
jgi:hypothetical protein